MADELQYVSLLVASVIAFLMPYIARRINIPVMVGEITLGIAVGFVGVGLEHFTGETFLDFATDSHVYFLSEIGFIFLLFLAGLEIDFNMIEERGPKPVLKSIVMFLLTLILASGATMALGLEAPFFMALVIATTSLGVVIPVVRELGISKTKFGQDIILAAIIADFATMILIPLAVGLTIPGENVYISLAIIPILFLVFWFIYKFGGYLMWRWPGPMSKFFRADDPSETGVRASFLLIMIFIVLSQLLRTEVILGAFLAGAAIAFMFRESGVLESKLFGFGYGFLIPLFFVRVGVEFAHIVSGEEGMSGLLWVPVLIAITYVVKVLPSLIQVPEYGARQSLANGVLISGGLSLAIAAAEIGRKEGVIDQPISAAIIFFAILMAIVSPIVFRFLHALTKEPKEEERVFELVTIEGRPLEGGVDSALLLKQDE